MTRCTAFVTTVALMASVSAGTQSAETQRLVITREGSRAVERAPEANFTGDVRVERLFDRTLPQRRDSRYTRCPCRGQRPHDHATLNPTAPALFLQQLMFCF